MKRYSIITYRLNKAAKPADVLTEIENLMQKYSAQHQSCLFKATVLLVECEFEGKVHSNATKNAIVSICKKYSAAEPFFRRVERDAGLVNAELSISNFSENDYSQKGTMDDSLIHEIVTKIPQPYSVHDLELIFDGVSFAKGNKSSEPIKPSPSGFGAPVGNYVFYERSAYGSEKHSYVHFSAEDALLDDMRRLFFDFAERIPGKYEKTEIQKDQASFPSQSMPLTPPENA